MSNNTLENTTFQTQDELSEAMNSIGQQLYQALTQSVQNLPQHLRKGKIINQALAAFLTNVILRQFPDDKQAQELTINQLTAFIKIQLENI